MSRTLLVFGRQGQVARAIAEAPDAGFALEFAGRERLDLAQPSADIAALIAEVRPAAVINAAAYTAVDRAEAEPLACERLNRDAPARMAQACAAAQIPFTHFSTDYVFDGEKGAPYVEEDPRRPLNVYGRTKAEGEDELEAIRATGARVAVIRCSWVFSAQGPGFLQSMLRLGREGGEVAVVDDQHGCPTPSAASASAALALTAQMLDRDAAAVGTFHAAGAEAMSWADFAQAIFAASPHCAARVRRIPTTEYKTAAVRPKDTRLDCARLQSISPWRAPDFAEALAECLGRVGR
ncbi:MAG: dTDP-4-dehydrorhamnose reductase [Caulobacterales bacterium]